MNESALITRLAELMGWKVAKVDDDLNLFLHGKQGEYSCGTWNPATQWRDFAQLMHRLQDERGGDDLNDILQLADPQFQSLQRRICEALISQP